MLERKMTKIMLLITTTKTMVINSCRSVLTCFKLWTIDGDDDDAT